MRQLTLLLGLCCLVAGTFLVHPGLGLGVFGAVLVFISLYEHPPEAPPVERPPEEGS